MTSSSSSLRDLYNDPSSAWPFLPAPPNTTTVSSTYVNDWKTSRPTIFDLSPSPDLNDSGVDVSLLLRSMFVQAFLQYSSTAIAMPLEVGKLLLQVQWVPRDAGEVGASPNLAEYEGDDSDSSMETESYFADPSSGERVPVPRLSDEEGYVLRRSVLEEGTRPEYVIPVGSANGVWGMIKRIGRFRGEGWLALWKGLLTFCVHDALFTTLQPSLDSLLRSLFFPSASPYQQPSIFLPVASHLLTGFILSPLDLVRTRLIIQSFIPRYRTYSGPVDALSQIYRHEGGVKGMYLHPHLLIPTLIDHTLRPLVSIAMPGLVASHLGVHVTVDSHPIAWGFAEFVGSCAGLLITLPFETIRRRLQAQVRGSAKPVKTCVETRPAPYNGVVDTAWHILTEERSDLPLEGKRARRGEESWLRNTGLGQLYRGLGMRLGASAIVFLLAVVSGGEERDSGWREL